MSDKTVNFKKSVKLTIPKELQPKKNTKLQIYEYIQKHPSSSRADLTQAFPKRGDRVIRRALEELKARDLLKHETCKCGSTKYYSVK